MDSTARSSILQYGYAIEPIVSLESTSNCHNCWGELLCREIPRPATLQAWRGWYKQLPHILVEALSRYQFKCLSVNVDSEHLLDHEILGSLRSLKGLPILLEWTENPMIGAGQKEIAEAISRLCRLRDRWGFPIIFDDVGSGEDSLQRLCALQPDIVKIDGELFQRCRHDHRAYKLLASHIALYRDQGIPVVMEWIETQQDLDLAKKLNVNWGQGFFWQEGSCQSTIHHAPIFNQPLAI